MRNLVDEWGKDDENAEEIVLTLMFLVIPIVPDAYVGSKIKIGLCFE